MASQRRHTVTFAAVLLGLAAGQGAEASTSCNGASVVAIDVSEAGEAGLPTRPTAEPAAIDMRRDAGDRVHLRGLGPILGSMDAHALATNVRCTAQGIEVWITVTRSAEYVEGLKKNVLWRPVVEADLRIERPGSMAFVWAMNLSSGAAVDMTRMPPFPAQRFPARVSISVP
jgi:hypothetical protein